MALFVRLDLIFGWVSFALIIKFSFALVLQQE